jgi:SAM-dependent methyltransferase
MSSVLVNVACGNVYVDGWINLDYAPVSPAVIKANLLDLLPFADGAVDLLYTSHFIEHIPRPLVIAFLKESFRVTKSGGYARLVLPDLEELCRAYLVERERGTHDKANFIVLEMLDQCVRTTPGGELGAYYAQLQSAPQQNASMINYVRLRTGHDLQIATTSAGGRWKRALPNPAKILGKLEQFYCRAVLAILPAAFRSQNVSLASVGERHAWIYDFYTVEKLLKHAGFADVQRVTANTSNIPNFPFFPLDVYEDGSPRKGLESMHIEAMKP